MKTSGVEPLRHGETFPVGAAIALANPTLRRNIASATATIRTRRSAVVSEMDDWEQLRTAAEVIKSNAMSQLPELLEELERNVEAAGGVVHWARDAAEACAIVGDIVALTGEHDVVKVKSMVTQEIGLNEALQQRGINAVETDLAELIVQLAEDRPSHILVPAIHLNRSEIRDVFRRSMPGAPAELTDDPAELARAARAYLRHKFLTTKVAVSGANAAIADSGSVIVVESEGNGRMCLTLPEVLITVMGVEKVMPTWTDQEVFMQVLPRSSTGERMNPYTSVWTGVVAGDGPQSFHLVLVDNGRANALADPGGRAALHCIKCSACLNVCPVYEQTGGHAYGSVYPGPIGAVLTPQLTGLRERGDPSRSLPFASTLCGACYDACPVKIDIPTMLVHLRSKVVDADRSDRIPTAQDVAMRAAGWVLADARRLAWLQRVIGATSPLFGRGMQRLLPPPASRWVGSRDAPTAPRASFRSWWSRKQKARA